MLNCSRDKNEGTYRVVGGGEEGPPHVAPDLSYYWEGASRE